MFPGQTLFSQNVRFFLPTSNRNGVSSTAGGDGDGAAKGRRCSVAVVRLLGPAGSGGVAEALPGLVIGVNGTAEQDPPDG